MIKPPKLPVHLQRDPGGHLPQGPASGDPQPPASYMTFRPKGSGSFKKPFRIMVTWMAYLRQGISHTPLGLPQTGDPLPPIRIILDRGSFTPQFAQTLQGPLLFSKWRENSMTIMLLKWGRRLVESLPLWLFPRIEVSRRDHAWRDIRLNVPAPFWRHPFGAGKMN